MRKLGYNPKRKHYTDYQETEWEKVRLDFYEKWVYKMSFAEEEHEIKSMKKIKDKEYRELKKVYNR